MSGKFYWEKNYQDKKKIIPKEKKFEKNDRKIISRENLSCQEFTKTSIP